jgi:hypothetical protein
MSSLARRTFRTAAAAAGIAALGVGISAPAWGVEVPGVLDADVVEGPGVPGHTIDQTLAVIPASASELAALPQLFTFEAPSFTTTAPGASESATAEEADVEDREATDELAADESDAARSDATPSAEASTLPTLPALGQLPANLRIPLPKGNAVEIGTP